MRIPTSWRRAKRFSGVGSELRFWSEPLFAVLRLPTGAVLAQGEVLCTGAPVCDDREFMLSLENSAELEHSLRQVDGRFSLCAVVSGGKRAIFATDILGVSSVFYTVREGRVYIASHLGLLVESLERHGIACLPDNVGVVSSVAGSLSIEGRTPVEGVSRLLAGEYMVVEVREDGTHGLTVSRYQDPMELDGGGNRQVDDWLEVLRHSIRQQSQVDSIFLTSGYDSYALGALLHPGRRETMIAASYGGADSSDRLGGEVAAGRLGFKHKSIKLYDGEALTFASDVAQLNFGTCGLQVTQHFAGVKRLAETARSAYSGFLGDILSGKPYHQGGDLEALAIQRCLSWEHTLLALDQGDFADEIGYIRASLKRGLAAMPGTVERKAIMLDLLYRQAHWIGGTFELLDQVIDIFTPFFSRAVIAASLGGQDSAAKRRERYTKTMEAFGHSQFKGFPARAKMYPAIDWAKETEAHRIGLMAACHSIGDERWRNVALKSIENQGPGFPLALKVLPCFGLGCR